MHLFPSSDIGPFGRRQRHVRGHRIPVTITRDHAPQDGGTAIIADTFGAGDVAPLPGGCPCCTVRVDLQSALRRLLSGRDEKSFSRVVVESAEDIGPMLRTFVSARALGGEYHVEAGPPLDGNRFTLTTDGPLAWGAFTRFVTTLTALRGTDLLCAGGLLNIEGCRGPVAVQLMGHLAARPVELQAWPTNGHGSRLEFVTRNIDERTVRDLFDATRALA